MLGRARVRNLILTVTMAASAWGQQTAAPIPPGAVVLDHVVAVINGSVILESDVREEMRYAVLQPFSIDSARNTPQRALQRLIDRDLILQQIQTAETVSPPTPEDVHQRILQLRGAMPECEQYHCDTEAGWQAFLKAKGLT
jgi:peptidyl-prolyl cis-trans isomerase SurA